METDNRIAYRILGEVDALTRGQVGTVGLSTALPRLTIWTSTVVTKPTSAIFEPMFYAVLRGAKHLIMGANRFELRPGLCAVSSFGLPYIHQMREASHSQPYVGISLHFDATLLARVMLDLPKPDISWSCAVAAGDLDGHVGETFSRFVSLLKSTEDIGLLAPHYEYEFYYRLLQSSMSDTLRQVGQRNERFLQLKAAADWLAQNYGEPIQIPDLASASGMSVTSFHRHFKEVTGFSPLAFQRHVRLLEAQKLLSGGGSNVSQIAFDVGYQSASQFSREYKAMFGRAPVADLER